ncbi:MAG: hypothetical protein NTY36_01425 [Deltaproteobacteria bacterium]|nr:hypothetical protein [Deltaproteobacteria bacterium]
MSNRSNRKCATGKVGFCSQRRAMMACARIAANSRRDYLPERAYHCWRCGRWHLTSQPKEG